ncbi:phosphatase PAP2 family protein [Streptomyces ipomoeae]|uniref:phosphatase PAP2 family protein n=1 Tax=Streptomyces ipomoeae TaxID=103232 RepID=UPI0011472451|nr:phosphatase PAP2 family protein [Streptomyces ipomoeae]MDX2933895.1 phosphatase PAP2 family protein [Streptomyces ipomoeae]TQE28844.1 phosphatase PAP2 family protein [Streptomyces ipomoeae]
MPSSAGHHTLNRRVFLRNSLGVSAGLIAAPTLANLWQAPEAKAATAFAAFVDDYTTNTTANLTPETNAVVRALGGFAEIWKTGAAWNTGTPLMPEVSRANIRYSERVTARRTEAQAREAFITDRQHQSYSVISGLGPLAELYRTGAMAVTSITSAPDGTPPGKISDSVPADAPAGSANGAGSTTSELGKVAELVNTVRGPFASSNPAKFSYQYPRPWRMNENSEVVDTGRTDEFGFPVYDSDVVVAPQLLRQRGEDPATDGGFPSGHTNALHLAALAYAYAVPERFQEMVTRAFEASHDRIVSGMHSALDVIGGRVMATALAAATLADPKNASLKAAARKQAAEYFQAKTGTTADTLFAYAHSAGTDTDPYADREANARLVEPKLTYVLTRRGRSTDLTVPKGAEVLLETRLPYLDAAQRREVLRTTALPSGYVLLDGWEQWGRLNLFAAADAYGAFAADVEVTMDASLGGFHTADTWRNDICGPGGLVKRGSGTLTLAGANEYTGGTTVEAGVLAAGSKEAFGRGDVRVKGGTLRTGDHTVRVRGGYAQAGVLDITLDRGTDAALVVDGRAVLERGSSLVVRFDAEQPPRDGSTVAVIGARSLQGRFSEVTVAVEGWTAEQVFTARGVSVRLRKR